MSKMIETFLAQMREQHGDEIAAVELPEGTEAYIAARIAAGDSETLTFMLKLAYLMGLNTGYAAHEAAQQEEPTRKASGPLQA